MTKYDGDLARFYLYGFPNSCMYAQLLFLQLWCPSLGLPLLHLHCSPNCTETLAELLPPECHLQCSSKFSVPTWHWNTSDCHNKNKLQTTEGSKLHCALPAFWSRVNEQGIILVAILGSAGPWLFTSISTNIYYESRVNKHITCNPYNPELCILVPILLIRKVKVWNQVTYPKSYIWKVLIGISTVWLCRGFC